MKPVKRLITYELRRKSCDGAYIQHPNCRTFDHVWIDLGSFVSLAIWNQIRMPLLLNDLMYNQK